MPTTKKLLGGKKGGPVPPVKSAVARLRAAQAVPVVHQYITGQLRNRFGVDRGVWARALGVSEQTLADWEDGKAQPSGAQLAKAKRVVGILERFAKSVRKKYIPTWLIKPNDACKEIGASNPVELMEKGDYGAVEDMVSSLGSGVPY
jgi:hypothetical protein